MRRPPVGWRRLVAGPAAAALLLALGGCVTMGQAQRVAQARQQLAAAAPCCTALATARREPLPLVPQERELGAESPVFDFGGRKAYFALFELPVFRQPYAIVVSGLASGGPNDMAMVLPHLSLYDQAFVQTREFDDRSLRHRGNSAERTVFINPGNAAERFLLVRAGHSTETMERAQSMVTTTPVMAGPVMFHMVSGSDSKALLHASPVGRIRLEVQGLPVPAAP